MRSDPQNLGYYVHILQYTYGVHLYTAIGEFVFREMLICFSEDTSFGFL